MSAAKVSPVPAIEIAAAITAIFMATTPKTQGFNSNLTPNDTQAWQADSMTEKTQLPNKRPSQP
jgi:hypothetical protein